MIKSQGINKEKLSKAVRDEDYLLFCVPLGRSVRCGHKRGDRGITGIQRVLYSGPRPTESLRDKRDHTGRAPRVPLNQMGGKQRKSKDPQQELYWGSG